MTSPDRTTRRKIRQVRRAGRGSSRNQYTSGPRAERVRSPEYSGPAPDAAGIGKTVKTPVGDAPLVPVVVMGIGAYLAWFGVHYWRSDIKWPTDPLKAILQGKGLPKATQTPTADEQAVLAAARKQEVSSAVAGGVLGAVGASTPPPSGSTAANVNTGKLLAAKYGWGPGTADWNYLYSGWMEESGWRTNAANVPSDPYNHAYGIPQANPGTKMASAGADWKTSAATQISWGLKYIKDTYGAPSRVPGWTPNGPAAGYKGY